MAENYNLNVKVNYDGKTLNQGVKGAQSAITRLNNTVTKLGTSFGITFGVIGAGMLIKNSIKKIADFDEEMVNMAAIIGKSRGEVTGLESEIRKIASSSRNTASDVAKMATSMFTLGKSESEVKRLLSPVNDLSIALKASADDAAELLISTLNAFGKGTDSANEYANIIAKTRTSTALDFERIKVALSFVAPAANALGLSLSQTNALLGTLSDNGIRASRAGRLLSSSFARLTGLGISLDDALDQIRKSENKTATATELFGTESFTLGLILADNEKKIKSYTEQFNDAGGTLDDLTKKQLSSLNAKLDILNSSWEEFLITVGNTNPISSFIDTITEAVQGMTNLDLLFKTFTSDIEDFSPEELKKLIDLGLETGSGGLFGSGTGVKELLQPLIDLPADKITSDFRKVRKEVIDSIVATGEDANEARILVDSYISTLSKTPGNQFFDFNHKAAESIKEVTQAAKSGKPTGVVNDNFSADFIDPFSDLDTGEGLLLQDFRPMFEMAARDIGEGGALLNQAVDELDLNFSEKIESEMDMNIQSSKQMFEEFKEEYKKFKDDLIDISSIVEGALVDTFTSISSGLAAGEDVKKVWGKLLGIFGDALSGLGAALIASGIALKALESGGPVVKIVAGIAAIAAGSLAKKKAAQISNAGGAAGISTPTIRSGGGSGTTGTFNQQGQATEFASDPSDPFSGGREPFLGSDAITFEKTGLLFSDLFYWDNETMTVQSLTFDKKPMLFSNVFSFQNESISTGFLSFSKKDLSFSSFNSFKTETIGSEFLSFGKRNVNFSSMFGVNPESFAADRFVNFTKSNLNFSDIVSVSPVAFPGIQGGELPIRLVMDPVNLMVNGPNLLGVLRLAQDDAARTGTGFVVGGGSGSSFGGFVLGRKR